MSFDLDEKEFRDGVAKGEADWLWSAYTDLQFQIQNLSEIAKTYRDIVNDLGWDYDNPFIRPTHETVRKRIKDLQRNLIIEQDRRKPK